MSSMNSPTGAHEAGAMSEAATAALISDVLGGDLIYQHTPGEAPQGIDLAYLDDGQLHVAEVKSIIGDWHQPTTSSTVDGRQMDAAWVADRIERTGIAIEAADVGVAENQVQTDLFQVDFKGDTIARYDIGLDGRRAETAPSEIYALSEILEAHERSNSPEPEITSGTADAVESRQSAEAGSTPAS